MAYTDLRFALRLLRLRPASSAAVVLTLAMAIGANSTLFTVINAALLAPLPVADAERLVNVYTSDPDGTGFNGLSYPDYLDFTSSNGALEDALGYSGLMATVTGDGSSEVVFGEIVTPNYFSVLGVPLARGRGFTPAESAPVVVIGDRFWRRRFNADPAVIGQPVALNGRPYEIIGVAPAGFSGLLFRAISPDIWVPVSMMGAVRTDQRNNRDERWMFVKGRLKSAATAEEAQAAATVIGSGLAASFPASNKGRQFRVRPTLDVIVHPEGDRAVLAASAAIMAAAGLVLVVACANLAGIMLARGLARRREIAIRLAIGARRRDVIRQLFVESAVLSIIGGAGGLIAARWMAALLASWRPDLPVPISLNTTADLRVMLFTLTLTVAATVLFALLPALRIARTPAAGSMTAGMSGRRRRLIGLRDAVLVPQLAVAILLIAIAGLLARSLSKADGVDPGFDLRRTAFVALNLSMSGYDDDRARRFFEELARALEARGTIVAAGMTSRLPLDLYGDRSATITTDVDDVGRSVQIADVGEGYFAAMGIPIVRGRGLEGADARRDAAPVTVVSAAAARRYWPDSEPVGRRLRLNDESSFMTVVGVVADVKVQTLGEVPQPFVYVPLVRGQAALQRLVVQASGDPAAAVMEMRKVVRELDPAVAVFEARTMADNLHVMLYPYRAGAAVGSALALIAVVLAGVGLYGVLACGVNERLREIAIRMALGAPAVSLLRTVAAGTVRAIMLGAALGALMAIVAGRLLAGVLFGISPADPPALVLTVALLALVVAAASVGPLTRALRAAPMSMLRTSD
jgi:predicted permease